MKIETNEFPTGITLVTGTIYETFEIYTHKKYS